MYIEKSITSEEQLENILISNTIVLLFFKTNSCNVGEAIEPKINELINTYFPKIECFTVDMTLNPEITANYAAFIEPTIIVFFDGKETIKKSRNFSIAELKESIERPYQLIFN